MPKPLGKSRLPLNNSPTWRLAHRVRSSFAWLVGWTVEGVDGSAMGLYLRAFSTASGVASRGEQRQLIWQRPVCRPGFRFCKDFIQRDLFKRQDRQDLEYRVEWGLDSELLANRRDQHVDRDGHPELRLDGIL